MDFLSRPIRAVVRKLLRSPFFTLVSVLTLAIGIGANTAIFSVVYSVLIRPLPYPESERLVGVWHTAPGIGLDQFEQSDATYLFYRRSNRVFEELGIYRDSTVNLIGGERPERLPAAFVTPSLFQVLQAAPALGRLFTEDEERPGAPSVVILSHDLWTHHFGGKAEIVGQTIDVDGEARTVAGVMKAGFHFPSRDTRMWLPLQVDPQAVEVGNFNFQAIARMRSGISPEAAVSDLATLVARLPEEYSDGFMTAGMLEQARLAPLVYPLRQDTVGDVSSILWILMGSVGFILLIACANVANLFLVRADGRRREVAVRSALGATRGGIARVFLAESTALSLAGGALGLLLATVGLRIFIAIGPQDIPRLDEIGVDGNVLAFTAAIALGAGLLFGLIPALRSMPQLSLMLKDGGRGATAGRNRHRARGALVACQIALALILLIGSGLMVRSFQQLRNVDPGFDADSVLTLRLSLPTAEYEEPERRASFFHQLLEQIRGLPGVESAGAVSDLPLTGSSSNSGHALEDFPLEPDEVPPIIPTRYAAPGYFETLQIPLLEGRVFETADHQRPTGTVLVNSALAERYWPGESALGKRLTRHVGKQDAWAQIVGVVGSVRDEQLEQDPIEMIYYPLVTLPNPEDGVAASPRTLTLAMRTNVPPMTLAGPVRAAIAAADPNLPVANLRTLEQVVAGARARTGFTMLLLLIAAAVALLLGAIGLYGVITYMVAQRTQEIGVRMALGARRQTVSRMIVKQGLGMALVGIAIGLVGAFATTRWLAGFLFGVGTTDPLTFVIVPLLLLAIAIVASYLPARRAASVDPLVALRHE